MTLLIVVVVWLVIGAAIWLPVEYIEQQNGEKVPWRFRFMGIIGWPIFLIVASAIIVATFVRNIRNKSA